MPFKAGESGNKKGRPRMTAQQKNERERFIRLLRENTVSALESIVEIASDDRNRDRLKACQYLIDKAYGNTAFLVDDEVSEPLTIHIVRSGQSDRVQDEDDDWD